MANVPKDPVFFPTPADFRAWLEEHHATESELWVGYYKKATGRPSITWQESVDEALCFGWIDGIRKSLDSESYTNRFTPRKADSPWSEKNVKRMEELIREGRVHPSGLDAYARRREYAAARLPVPKGEEVTLGEYEADLRQRPEAWAFYESQPPHYRRVTAWWVVSAKREETRRRRLDKLIAHCEAGKRIPPMG